MNSTRRTPAGSQTGNPLILVDGVCRFKAIARDAVFAAEDARETAEDVKSDGRFTSLRNDFEELRFRVDEIRQETAFESVAEISLRLDDFEAASKKMILYHLDELSPEARRREFAKREALENMGKRLDLIEEKTDFTLNQWETFKKNLKKPPLK